MTLVWLFVGFVVAGVAGLPLVSRAVAWQLHRVYPPAHIPADKSRFMGATTLTPADFGPVQLQWPSERPARRAARPPLAWPSSRWDDDAFGRSPASRMADEAATRADEAAEAAARGRRPITTSESASRAARPSQAVSAAASASSARAASGASSRRPAPTPGVTRPMSSSPAAPPLRSASAPTPARAAPRSAIPDGQGVSDAMARRLIEQHGLVGAARVLMRDHGLSLEQASVLISRLHG